MQNSDIAISTTQGKRARSQGEDQEEVKHQSNKIKQDDQLTRQEHDAIPTNKRKCKTQQKDLSQTNKVKTAKESQYNTMTHIVVNVPREFYVAEEKGHKIDRLRKLFLRDFRQFYKKHYDDYLIEQNMKNKYKLGVNNFEIIPQFFTQFVKGRWSNFVGFKKNTHNELCLTVYPKFTYCHMIDRDGEDHFMQTSVSLFENIYMIYNDPIQDKLDLYFSNPTIAILWRIYLTEGFQNFISTKIDKMPGKENIDKVLELINSYSDLTKRQLQLNLSD